jgi:hypothetical protein
MLTAHVTANGAPVHPGTVTFCNANAAHCEDAAILGTAQLTTDGTARLPLRLGVDTYSIKAIFHATPHSPTPRAARTSAVCPLPSKASKAALPHPSRHQNRQFLSVIHHRRSPRPPSLTGTVSFTGIVNNGSPLILETAPINASPAQFTWP